MISVYHSVGVHLVLWLFIPLCLHSLLLLLQVRQDIAAHDIRIYPSGYDPEDEAEKQLADAIDVRW